MSHSSWRKLDFLVGRPSLRLGHEQELERLVDMRRDRLAGDDAALLERRLHPAGGAHLVAVRASAACASSRSSARSRAARRSPRARPHRRSSRSARRRGSWSSLSRWAKSRSSDPPFVTVASSGCAEPAHNACEAAAHGRAPARAAAPRDTGWPRTALPNRLRRAVLRASSSTRLAKRADQLADLSCRASGRRRPICRCSASMASTKRSASARSARALARRLARAAQ